MNDTHLTDDVLAALCLTEAASEGSGHLAACPACERRLVALAAMLDDISETATAAADEAFPPERRARQHARILQRIDHQAGFGKVLTFPHASASLASAHPRPTRMRRWVAAAAAAGLFIGLLAGQLVHQLPGLNRVSPGPAAPSQVAPTRQPAATVLRTVSSPLSDEELLLEIERSIDRTGPVALGRLDALTPVAWNP